jgi:hypothetical protein
MDELRSATESQHYDRKSLRLIAGGRADFSVLARDCVGFANASGGRLDLGIEDDEQQPSADQLVDAIWEAVPDFRERYEVPEGLFRSIWCIAPTRNEVTSS